jgi:transcription antitermination factor NusG
METSLISATLAQAEPAPQFDIRESTAAATPHWYASSTCANHEKRVVQQLRLRSIPYFLPVYESVRTWKDRRKRLELPLFPGYIFVRIPVKERLRVLELASVVRLVGFGGLPCALPDAEIEALHNIPPCRLRAEPYGYPAVGRPVRITRGPLQGMEGTLVRRKGSVRLVLSIDMIRQSASVEVDITDVEPLRQSAVR